MPDLSPDLSFDQYDIGMWIDVLRYRLRRTAPDLSIHYLGRDPGGSYIWVEDPSKAESWEAAQGAALALVHKLNQDGVTG